MKGKKEDDHAKYVLTCALLLVGLIAVGRFAMQMLLLGRCCSPEFSLARMRQASQMRTLAEVGGLYFSKDFSSVTIQARKCQRDGEIWTSKRVILGKRDTRLYKESAQGRPGIKHFRTDAQ